MSHPSVSFYVLNKDACIRSVSQFFDDNNLPFGRFQSYIASNFSFDLKYLESLPQEQRRKEIYTLLENIYNEKLEQMQKAKCDVEKLFNESKDEIFSTIESVFNINLAEKNIKAGIMFNQVCPRYLEEFAFEIYYGASAKYNLQTCIHEIIHFYYFEKWKEVFTNYDSKTFEAPHLIWLLSEMSIDAIFKSTSLKKFLTDNMPAYQYFYSASINGKPILLTLKNLFENNSIENYFKKAMDFIYENKSFFKSLT